MNLTRSPWPDDITVAVMDCEDSIDAGDLAGPLTQLIEDRADLSAGADARPTRAAGPGTPRCGNRLMAAALIRRRSHPADGRPGRAAGASVGTEVGGTAESDS